MTGPPPRWEGTAGRTTDNPWRTMQPARITHQFTPNKYVRGLITYPRTRCVRPVWRRAAIPGLPEKSLIIGIIGIKPPFATARPVTGSRGGPNVPILWSDRWRKTAEKRRGTREKRASLVRPRSETHEPPHRIERPGGKTQFAVFLAAEGIFQPPRLPAQKVACSVRAMISS